MHFRDLLRASIAAALRYHKDTSTEEIDLIAGSLAESVGFGRRAALRCDELRSLSFAAVSTEDLAFKAQFPMVQRADHAGVDRKTLFPFRCRAAQRLSGCQDRGAHAPNIVAQAAL